MQTEIITIGDELLIGQVVDTNSAWISQQLNLIGLKVFEKISISDNADHIFQTLKTSLSRSNIVLITGGLGPTKDDITKKVLCDFFETSLITDLQVLADVENFILARHGKMNELNKKQAEVPAGCTVIRNSVGTAPILWFERNGHILIAMPGVPFEMKMAMESSILPRLKSLFKLPVITHKNILITGIGEAMLADKISNWEDNLPEDFHLAYLPSPGLIRLRISVYGNEGNSIDNQILLEIEKLKLIIPNEIFGYDEQTMEEIVGIMLLKKGSTISTAESCTGGAIAKLITSVSGSSAYFNGGIIAYSNQIKSKILNVGQDIIEKYGAVSQQVVEEMVKGALAVLGSDYAISISGIAGPTGGTNEKPVGTVWISVASSSRINSKLFNFGDNRERNITRASFAALNMLREFLLVE